MYSFFYLKAYWNPYGEGNIDNLPVAIVNNDTGAYGTELIESITDSKKLKISVVSESDANDGLYNGEYYAVINIPDDFTSDIESAGTNNKTHATITYSPNQKANYLASQIINSVVNAVEKNLDNKVNSSIISTLEESVTTIPSELETISDGFSKLEDGTSKLASGSNDLNEGLNTLNSNYTTFDDGITSLNSGSKSVVSGMCSLKDGINSAYLGSKKILDSVNANIESMKNSDAIDDTTLAGIKKTVESTISNTFTADYATSIGSNAVETVKQTYSNNISTLEKYGISESLVSICTDSTNPNYATYESTCTTNADYINQYATLKSLINELNNENSILYTTISNTAITAAKTAALSTADTVSENVAKSVAESAVNQSIKSLETLTAGLDELTTGLNTLNTGANTLVNGLNSLDSGINTLYVSSGQVKSGINTLYTGSSTLNTGIKTLYTSVATAKNELDSKIDETKEEVETANGLSTYSEGPVVVNTTPVNEVSSYGTAFSPFFISIALWVGSLMMFMVLYYDKKERFGILGINSPKRVQRTLAYHGLASLSAIILGIALNLFLDFEITNIFLYYISLILIANAFMAIMNFLITNFGDIGKFLGLIILVLQLAAAGGTFPIETVTKCFRWLNPLLPMTYTNKLMKESLIAIESNLLTKYILIVLGIFLVFLAINICLDIYKSKKDSVN
jgi:putative membrane protein